MTNSSNATPAPDPDFLVRAVAFRVHGIFTAAAARLPQALSLFPRGCEVARPYGLRGRSGACVLKPGPVAD